MRPADRLLFAMAAGLAVGSIYLAHPLLDLIGRDLGIPSARVGLVVTLTQIGYAVGLVMIVPLGDMIDRRRIIMVQIALSAAALALVGLAPSAGVLLAGMVLVGLLAVVVQVLVAFAATLADPEERGHVVGTVTGGVVMGILSARFVAGVLADLGGWRAAYLTAAALSLVMGGLLWRVMPAEAPPTERSSYLDLLGSTMRLFLEEPVLRLRALLALLIFATFSTFWTALVLPLSAPPIELSHTAIGLFGLAGVAGALGAGRAGRLADAGHGQWVTGAALALLLVSWLPIALMTYSLLALVVGVIALDLAIQAVHVTSQSMIFALRPEARSRLVGGYMVFYSIGSALGAITSTSAYGLAGWPGVCLLGASFSLAALTVFLLNARCSVDASRSQCSTIRLKST
jgi:predicted MFS family arabinose efflux permease